MAQIRDLKIAQGEPVSIQTMYDSAIPHSIEELDCLLKRIDDLRLMGCDIIRFSYPSEDDHEAFSYLCSHSPIPTVADIHFDYRMALDCMDCGFDKIRINPGNIGAKWKVEEVVRKAKDKNIAIRIGLNSGSLPKGEGDHASLMCSSALEYIDWFEKWGFTNTVVSLKSSDGDETYRANTMFASQCGYPLHLGVTEAGTVISSVARSTWALGRLLTQGIGNTIRISITGDIETEVQAAVEILRALGLRKRGIKVISCPRCGRHTFDTHGFMKEIEPDLLKIDKDLTVAFMGCQVNGPGEAKGADLAITGLGKKVFLYKNGELYREVSREDARSVLLEEIYAE